MKPGKSNFTYKDLMSSKFRQAYGDYLLGEIKDSLSFYYDGREYEIFLKFFEYLNGHNKFSYENYLAAFDEFNQFLTGQDTDKPSFMQSPEEFLQFLYDLNIVNFIEIAEDERFIRWCFLERSISNISPKVKVGMTYEIHYGLANILNVGKTIHKGAKPQHREQANAAAFLIGTVVTVNHDRKFGFIKQEQIPMDIYFQIDDVVTKITIRRNQKVRLRLSQGQSGKLTAVDIRAIE